MVSDEAKIYGKVLLIFAGISLVILSEVRDSQQRDFIEKNGVLISAAITDVGFSRGYYFNCKYFYNSNICHNTGSMKKLKLIVGDSILIKILPTDLEGNFVLEGKK